MRLEDGHMRVAAIRVGINGALNQFETGERRGDFFLATKINLVCALRRRDGRAGHAFKNVETQLFHLERDFGALCVFPLHLEKTFPIGNFGGLNGVINRGIGNNRDFNPTGGGVSIAVCRYPRFVDTKCKDFEV